MITSQANLAYVGDTDPTISITVMAIPLISMNIFTFIFNLRQIMSTVKKITNKEATESDPQVQPKSTEDQSKEIITIITNIINAIFAIYIAFSILFGSNKLHIRNIYLPSPAPSRYFILCIISALMLVLQNKQPSLDNFYPHITIVSILSIVKLFFYIFLVEAKLIASVEISETGEYIIYLDKDYAKETKDSITGQTKREISANLNGIQLLYNIENKALEIELRSNPELHKGRVNKQNTIKENIKYIESQLKWTSIPNVTMKNTKKISDIINDLSKIYQPIIDVYTKENYDTLLRFGVKTSESNIILYNIITPEYMTYEIQILNAANGRECRLIDSLWAADKNCEELLRKQEALKLREIRTWKLANYNSLNEYIQYLHNAIKNETVTCEEITEFINVLSCAIQDYQSYNSVEDNSIVSSNKIHKISQENWQLSNGYLMNMYKSICFSIDTSKISVEVV